MLEILEEFKALGVEVIPDGEGLLIRPASKVPAGLKERLRACKAEVLAALMRPTVERAECRHCEGKGECPCPACNLRRIRGPVPCCMCQPYRRQIWLAGSRRDGCWHCGGSARCKCISCRSGVCVVCGGKAQ